MKFHHIGLVSINKQDSERFLNSIGYKKKKDKYCNNFKLHFSFFKKKNSPDIEVISKGKYNTNDFKKLAKFAGKFYHICFEKIDKNDLVKFGSNLILEKKYSSILNKEVSFIFVNNIGLVEIIH